MGLYNKSTIKILYVETLEIALLDIPRELDALGYDVYKAALGIAAQEFRVEDCRKIIEAIDEYEIQCVISYDFVENIAQACFETGIPYIAWVYDSPQKELYTHYALYPGNYVFVFDKKQRDRLQQIGINEVYHMPLAVSAEKVALNLKGIKRVYKNEITLIGQLYNVEQNNILIEQADARVRDEIEASVSHNYLKWDRNLEFHGTLGEYAVNYFAEIDKNKTTINYPYITNQFYYEAAVISRLLAYRERTHILNALAEKYDVHFYTNDKNVDAISKKVHVHPGVKYDTEITRVYYSSKININITLHCIETGASQRIFDVMAAGGFMLSNYQQELEELFVPGEEIVLYHTEEELLELVEYYLNHDEERERIAQKGQEKVLKYHDYKNKLDQVIETVFTKEKSRKKSYLVMQREFLTSKFEDYLQQNNEEAHRAIYELCANRLYETAIGRNTQLGLVREMAECWQREYTLGTPCVFNDVLSLDQAEMKYLKVKHAIWRIEQDLSEERIMQTIEKVRDLNVSKFFVAWIIFSNLKDREYTYERLADLLGEFSSKEALQLIIFALFFMPQNDRLLLKKAEILLDMELWNDALSTLKEIKRPSDDIVGLINELSGALGL